MNSKLFKWIDTYASEEFADVTHQAIAITDQIAKEAREQERERMKDAFLYSSRIENMFWESAYRKE